MPGVDDLWPGDISDEEVRTPEYFLTEQCHHLEIRTGGKLRAKVNRTQAEDRVILGLQVESTRSGRSARLLEVSHRLNFEYPAHIAILVERLPDFLKKRVWKSGGLTTFISEGKWVDNPWITSSPEEFLEKFRSVLSRPAVKAAVLSLLAEPSTANVVETASGDGTDEMPDAADEGI